MSPTPVPDSARGTDADEQRLRALLLSLLVVPGAGQWARGRRSLGALMAVASVALVLAAAFALGRAIVARLPADLLDWDGGTLPAALWRGLGDVMPVLVPLLALLVAVWAWSACDAYRR